MGEPSIQQTPVSRLTTKLGAWRGEQLTVKSGICEGGGRGQGFGWAGTLAVKVRQSPSEGTGGNSACTRSPSIAVSSPSQTRGLGQRKTSSPGINEQEPLHRSESWLSRSLRDSPSMSEPLLLLGPTLRGGSLVRPVTGRGQGSWERGWQTWKPMLWHLHHRPSLPSTPYPTPDPHGGMFHQAQSPGFLLLPQPHSCLGRK